MSSKAVNEGGGKNRLRFSRLSQRLQKVNVDVIHRVRSKGGLDTHMSAVPETGERGCHFQDELERCKDVDGAGSFKRFYYQMWPLCQSLPELLHHVDKVVALLEDHLSKVVAVELGSFMQLCSVLARDLQEDIWPYFHRLFGPLVQRVNSVINAVPGSPTPELTGQLFECLSYLIKYASPKLVENHDSMRQYYGVLLGHHTAYVRDMSARCFVVLLRKLKSAAYTSHVKKLLKALAGQCRGCADVGRLSIAALEPGRSGGSGDGEVDAVPERMQHLVEGVSLLLFYAAKGIKGCLHSKGAARFTLPMELWVPLDVIVSAEVVKSSTERASSDATLSTLSLAANLQAALAKTSQDDESISKAEALSFACGSVMGLATVRLFRHLHPSNMAELWLRLAEGLANTTAHLDALACLSDCPAAVSSCAESAAMHSVELLLWAVTHSKGRGLSDRSVRKVVSSVVIKAVLGLVSSALRYCNSTHGQRRSSGWCNGRGITRLAARSRLLLCRLWLAFPRESLLLNRIDSLLAEGLRSVSFNASGDSAAAASEPPVLAISNELFGALPSDLLRKHVVGPVLKAVAALIKEGNSSQDNLWLVVVTEVLSHLRDVRNRPVDTEAQELGADVLSSAAALSQGRRQAHNASSSKRDWSTMDLEAEDEEEVGEDKAGAPTKVVEQGADLTRLLKSCSAELIFLAEAAADRLLHTISSLASSSNSSDKSNSSKHVGDVLACCVLRWMATACPRTLHAQFLRSPAYINLLQSATTALTGDLSVLTSRFGPSLMAHLVVFMCAERAGGEGEGDGVTKVPESQSSQLSKANKANKAKPQNNDSASAILSASSMPAVLRSFVGVVLSSQCSLALYWGLQELLECMQRLGAPGLCHVLSSKEQESLLELIAGSLCTPSYWLRMALLRLAAHFPSPSLASKPVSNSDASSSMSDSAEATDAADERTVDIVALLRDTALVSPDLRTEREFSRRMGSLEVLVRGQRLPAVFVKMACNFCLSMLHVKFQPFWEPSVAVLVAAAGAPEGEDILWPLLLQAIVKVGKQHNAEAEEGGEMEKDSKDTESRDREELESSSLTKPPKPLKIRLADDIDGEGEGEQQGQDAVGGDDQNDKSTVSRPLLHDCALALLKADSGESPVPLAVATSNAFFYILPDMDHMMVPPDSRADCDTVYHTAWSVLIKVPSITLRRSKVVVPMFLTFLSGHYYSAFCEDPEVPWLRHVGLFEDHTVIASLLPTVTAGTGAGFEQTSPDATFQSLSLRQLKTRLRMFLKVFAQVPSPKSLYRHELLFAFYTALTTSSETSLSSLALDCMLTYKPPYLMPFKDNLKRLLDDKTMREEMVTFDISSRNAAIDPRHRPDLIPLIVRLVYGRFSARARSSRSSKEQSITRRSAALTFFSMLEGSELTHFIQLLLRTVVPREALMNAPLITAGKSVVEKGQGHTHVTLSERSEPWYRYVQSVVDSVGNDDLALVSWERRCGFLHVLQQVIKTLGHAVSPHVASFTRLVLHMLVNAQQARENAAGDGAKQPDEDVDEADEAVDEDEARDPADPTQQQLLQQQDRALTRAQQLSLSLRVRTMCLSRLGEMVHQYHAQLDVTLLSSLLLQPLEPLLESMPQSIAGSTKVPALLKLLLALVSHSETASLVEQNSTTVQNIIRCLGSRCTLDVAQAVMDVMTYLLEMNGGASVLPHAALIISSFSRRFAGPGWDESGAKELKLNELIIVPSGAVRQELSLLCRIAESLFTRTDVVIEPRSVTSLATLLLGMLRTYTTSKKVRVEESWVADILRIYKALLPRLHDVAPHVGFISRLFGPAGHSQSLFNQSSVRNMLASVFAAVARHNSTRDLLVPSAAAIIRIVQPDSTTLLGRDFGACMPVFRLLSGAEEISGRSEVTDSRDAFIVIGLPPMTDSGAASSEEQQIEFHGWSSLLHHPQGSPRDVHSCTAVIFELLRCMSDDELVVRAAALASLRRLIELVASWDEEALVLGEQGSSNSSSSPVWTNVLLSTVMPALRKGLKEAPDIIKKGFVSLLSHAVAVLGRHRFGTDPFFHADLQCLQHNDPEQDFFENVTHIQSHRRVRAMMRLRVILKRLAAAARGEAAAMASTTVSNAESANKVGGEGGNDAMAVDDENRDDTHEGEGEGEGEDKDGNGSGEEEDDGAMQIAEADSALELEAAAAAATSGKYSFTATSLVHVLLPLACHPLYSDEFIKKDHSPLMHEAAAFLGAIALHLPWQQYLTLVKAVLKQLDKAKPEKEKILITALCSVLDSFHFDLSGDQEATDISVGPTSMFKGAPEPEPGQLAAQGLRQGQEGGQKAGADDDDAAEADLGADLDSAEALAAAGLAGTDPTTSAPTGASISRIVINSLMPWVTVFLLKADKDHKGQDSKVVRTGVAVALTKLVFRLQAPVVPEAKRLALFHSLVIKVVSTFKSRDTSARDQARDSLAKMVQTMGMVFLQPVVHELQHQLTLGYQRHVCNYTLRALLANVLETLKYCPPVDAASVPVLGVSSTEGAEADAKAEAEVELSMPAFDACIPLIMESVMDDVNGLSQGDREGHEVGANRKSIRESKGSKANEILEMCAKALLFRPTYALRRLESPASVSSVHALCGPLLEALGNSEDGALIGRVNEALSRVALGLAKNPSVRPSELLLYLHATLHPFVVAMIRDYEQHKRSLGMLNSAINANKDKAAHDGEDDEEEEGPLADDLPSYLREESSDEEEAALYSKPKGKGSDNVKGFRANTWLPTDRRAADQRAARDQRDREQRERDQVLDGASAPKLTGSQRHSAVKSKSSAGTASGGASDPAALVAVKFCLALLLGSIRRGQLDGTDAETRAMSMTFLPLLGQCLRLPAAGQVVALATRCMCGLLGWGLPVEAAFGRAVGARMLRLMIRGGALLSSDGDLVQACIRGLTSLFVLHNARVAAAATSGAAAGGGAGVAAAGGANNSRGNKNHKRKHAALEAPDASAVSGSGSAASPPELPLSEARLRALLQMLSLSVTEITSQYQSAAFALIKAVIESRTLLPELYDLVGKLTEQIVLSQRSGVRDACSTIVVDFITHYPMGEKRLQGHVRQLVANCSFEHNDGRRAAIEALTQLARLLPTPQLEDLGQTIFLPMTLRLVNDGESTCRVAAAGTVTALARRVSGELFSLLLEYGVKWSGSADRALVRTGAQVLSLLVGARPDLVKKSGSLVEVVGRACTVVEQLVTAEARGSGGAGLAKRELAIFAEGLGESGGTEDWAVLYHLLSLFESLYTHLPSSVDSSLAKFASASAAGAAGAGASGGKASGGKDKTHSKGQTQLAPPQNDNDSTPAVELIQEALLYPHAWVRASAARVLRFYLLRRDPSSSLSLSGSSSGMEPLGRPNALYHLARRLCVVLNQPELPEGLVEAAASSLVWTTRAMFLHPELSQRIDEGEGEGGEEEGEGAGAGAGEGAVEGSEGQGEDQEEEDDGEGEGEGEGESEDDDDDDDDDDEAEQEEEEPESAARQQQQPVPSKTASSAPSGSSGSSWVFQRLRGLGLDSRGHRRLFVLRVLRALLTACPSSEDTHLHQHLPQMIEVAMRCHQAAAGPDPEFLKGLREFAAELLVALEERFGSNTYIGVFSEVQRKVQATKAAKKRELARNAVANPAAFAMAKIAKRKRDAETKKKKKGKKAGGGYKKKRGGGDGAILYED